MFKKNATVLTSRALSGKDAKSLRSDVAAAFPALSEVAIDALVPAKASVALHKLSNRASVYSLTDDSTPLFFELHDQLLPTVYTLWRFPHALPSLLTYSEVSPKVLGGADLFLAGVIVPPEGLPDFKEGSPMAVRVPGHPFPFAIGIMECSSSEAKRSGMKGRGLRLLHAYTDLLWALGPKSSPHPSFKPTRIFPYESADNADNAAASSSTAPADAAAAAVQQVQLGDEPTEVSETCAAAVASNASHAAPSAPGAVSNECQPSASAAAAPAADLESPDAVAVHCLLAGLHGVQDSELPMMTSDFFSKHMVPAKPEGSTLDIKRTTWKKLSKLLTVHEKKGLLSQKLIHKQDHLTAVNRAHQVLQDFAPAQQSATAASTAASPSGRDAPPAAAAAITVTSAYRVPSSLQPVFRNGAKDQLYSAEQVADSLRQYAVGTNLLESPAANEVRLDRLLLGALFNKKEPQQEGDLHPVDNTVQRLLSKLQLWSRVTRSTPQGEQEVLYKGPAKNMLIMLEDRSGGRKHITKLSGMEAFGIDPDELATALQRRFQSSASVAKLPGKTEMGKEISLQGDQLNSAAAFLKEAYGLPPDFVTLKSRSKG